WQLQVSDLPQGTDFRLRVPERLGERLRRLVNAKGRYIDELDPPRHRELECEKGPFVVSRDAVKVGNGHPARAEQGTARRQPVLSEERAQRILRRGAEMFDAQAIGPRPVFVTVRNDDIDIWSAFHRRTAQRQRIGEIFVVVVEETIVLGGQARNAVAQRVRQTGFHLVLDGDPGYGS